MERDPRTIIRELQAQLEQSRRAEEETRRRLEEERLGRDEERRGRLREQELRINAESIADKTAFIPFLSFCYRYLFQPVTVQKDSSLQSSGGLTKIDSRYYPRELRAWTDFSVLHDAAFDELQELFGDQRLFPSQIAINQIQRDLSPSPLADEADLRPFELAAIELRAKDVITEYLAQRPQEVLRVIFRSNPYSLRKHESTETDDVNSPTPDQEVVSPNQDPGQSQDPGPSQTQSRGRNRTRGQSPRAAVSVSRQAQKRPAESPPPGSPDDQSAKRSTSAERRMVPDRWCLTQYEGKVRRPLFIVEYKAAHKATPDVLLAALDGQQCDTTLFADAAKAARLFRQKRLGSKLGNAVLAEDEVTEGEAAPAAAAAAAAAETTPREGASPSSTRSTPASRNQTAQILTQAFHYMIESGLAYSYVSTGESLILLHIDYATDPSVLYYRLSVPKREIRLPSVGEVDDAHPGLFPVEQHSAVVAKQTPIAHVLTMILLALQSTAASFEAKEQTKQRLKAFPEPYDNTTEQQADPSETPSSGKAPDAAQATEQGGGRDGRVVVGTARPPQQSYCTQQCLRGLRFGLAVDQACPNLALHQSAGASADGHGMAYDELAWLVQAQLAANLDDGCAALDGHGLFGAVGALFKVTVYPRGYTLVVKGVQKDDRWCLDWEERIYQRLARLQGTVVPVCLGVVDLRRAYVLTSGARIPCLLLLSYVGSKVRPGQLDDDRLHALDEVLLGQGVVHGDLRSANVLWNEEQQRLMVVDFDRAEIHEPSKRQRREWDRWERDGATVLTN